jgi:hypothetical protein
MEIIITNIEALSQQAARYPDILAIGFPGQARELTDQLKGCMVSVSISGRNGFHVLLSTFSIYGLPEK